MKTSARRSVIVMAAGIFVVGMTSGQGKKKVELDCAMRASTQPEDGSAEYRVVTDKGTKYLEVRHKVGKKKCDKCQPEQVWGGWKREDNVVCVDK